MPRCQVSGCKKNHASHLCGVCKDPNSNHRSKNCPHLACQALGCTKRHLKHFCKYCFNDNSDHVSSNCPVRPPPVRNSRSQSVGRVQLSPNPSGRLLRCDVQGCNEHHSAHFCRICGNPNSDHFSHNCPIPQSQQQSQVVGPNPSGRLLGCDVQGCNEHHSAHFCRICGNPNSDHFSRKCPILQQQSQVVQSQVVQSQVVSPNLSGGLWSSGCEVQGCKEPHSAHFCRKCGNTNSDHYSRNCPQQRSRSSSVGRFQSSGRPLVFLPPSGSNVRFT